VGTVTNTAVTARAGAQQRLQAVHARRAERDARVADAAAEVFQAQHTIRGNAERRALAVAAARTAIAAAEQAERDANHAAQQRILAAVGRVKGEGLTVARIAELLQLPVPDARRLVRRAATTAPGAIGGAPAAVVQQRRDAQAGGSAGAAAMPDGAA
jgi:hypothetical protein